jgi:hypothetical protein
MQLDWTSLTFAVIALFALSGFFKGWWKEAITTMFLVVLLFLLKNPTIAATLIDWVNQGTEWFWKFIPGSLLPTIEGVFGLTAGDVPVINASDPSTWLIIMIFFIAASIIISRYSLPDYGHGSGYEVRPIASIFGGLLGGLNGFIVMGLIGQYMSGTNLPGGGSKLPVDISVAGVADASNYIFFRVSNLSTFTLLDSYLPWILMILGVAVFVAAIKTRVYYTSDKKGYRQISVKSPYGYQPYKESPK